LLIHFTSALDCISVLRALAKVLLVPSGADVWLGAAGHFTQPRSSVCRMIDELALLYSLIREIWSVGIVGFISLVAFSGFLLL